MTTPLRHLVSARNDERMNSDFFFNILTQELFNRIYVGKYTINMFFYVNIHIFVLKYLVQIQIIQNQIKISEGGKWNSHQMPCVYSSRMVKNYRICPIRIEIIHGRHELFLNFTIADAFTIVIIHYVERTLVSCNNLCPIQLL